MEGCDVAPTPRVARLFMGSQSNLTIISSVQHDSLFSAYSILKVCPFLGSDFARVKSCTPSLFLIAKTSFHALPRI